MTDLLIPKACIVNAVTDERGNLTIELTEDGERRLLEEARLRTVRLAVLTERHRAKLRAMTTEELTACSLSRFGGPDQLERDEMVRRMHEFARTMAPVVATMRSTGLLPQEA